MRILVFVMRSMAGFILGWISVCIIIPVFCAGEVYSPLMVPFVGIVCILLTAIPFTMLQGRIDFSTKARPLVPVISGLCWMPFLLLSLQYPSVLVFPHANIWIAALKSGLLCVSASFIFSLFVVKTADIILLFRSPS